jgi:glycylpeptide N-tetradecanoyltransferase
MYGSVWNFAKDTHSHKVTDFFSFYSLPSTVINNPKHAVIEAAYLFYYASEVAFEEGVEENGVLKKRLERLIGDALIIAQQAEFDVFNALTLMDTVPVLRDLKVNFLFLGSIGSRLNDISLDQGTDT